MTEKHYNFVLRDDQTFVREMVERFKGDGKTDFQNKHRCKCKDCRFYDLETGKCGFDHDPETDNDPILGCWDYEEPFLRRRGFYRKER